MQFSAEQQICADQALSGYNVVIDASAGSGKSTTLLGIATLHKKRSLLLSFNTDIMESNSERAKEMGILLTSKKVRNKDEYVTTGHLDVSTFHRFGLRFFGRKYKVNPYKVDDYCEANFERTEGRRIAWVLKQIRGRGIHVDTVDQLKSELTNGAYIEFGKSTTNHWVANADLLFQCMTDLDSNTKVVDFDDMCRLPVKNRWIARSKPKDLPDVLYVDEYQDLNPDQRYMVEQCLEAKPNMQVIAVGDVKQAIYGFRGAIDAAPHMQRILGVEPLTLTTTYRCASSIVDFVNRQVEASEMVAHKDGGHIIRYYGEPDDPYGMTNLLDCDMIVSPRNSHLISIWIEFFLRDRNATLKGSGVISGIKQAIALIGTYYWGSFVKSLRELASSRKRSKDLGAHADMARGILELIERLNIRSKHELYDIVERMNLVDTGTQLETVHSAKGREARKVAVITDWWDDAQRDNMRYVAFTRAVETLVLVKLPKKEKGS